MRVFGVSVALGIIISDFYQCKGWTLRNVIELHQHFFFVNISLTEIFPLCQNFFLGYSLCMDFFPLNFPLHEFVCLLLFF